MLEHWLWLAHRPGLSRGERKIELLRQFGSVENLYRAGAEKYTAVTGIPAESLLGLLDKSLDDAQKIMEACGKKSIRIIPFDDDAYPVRLRSISDPPMVLYCRGNMPDFDSLPVIGVVGTRHPSLYGRTNAGRLGAEIARCGGLVVSGLAEGIDAEAMRGALEAEGTVVGVVGCGVDVVYPRSNADLFAAAEQHGCILSEFAPGTVPQRWRFPRRNRIISGLSVGVLVVEAPEKSGSLITARMAMEQGRDVFAFPQGSELSDFSGTEMLLREGAAPVHSGADVIDRYRGRFSGGNIQQEPIRKPEGRSKKPPALAEAPPQKRKKDIDNGTDAPYSDLKIDLADFTPPEQQLIRNILSGIRNSDDLISSSGLPPVQALRILTELEMRGIVIRETGRMVRLRR